MSRAVTQTARQEMLCYRARCSPKYQHKGELQYSPCAVYHRLFAADPDLEEGGTTCAPVCKTAHSGANGHMYVAFLNMYLYNVFSELR